MKKIHGLSNQGYCSTCPSTHGFNNTISFRVILSIQLLALLSPFLAPRGMGQVINDKMEKAIPLDWDTPHRSSTAECTVDWPCLNTKMTGQCISYHNDQWFIVPDPKPAGFYINIYGQDCRDIQGTQLVAFTGKACEPDTYVPYGCISPSTQDDFNLHIQGNGIPGPLWVNVDGYLHDFCSFTIVVSDKPKGFTMNESLPVTTTKKDTLGAFIIEWKHIDSIDVRNYYVYQRAKSEPRFQLKQSYSPHQFAYGQGEGKYRYIFKPENEEAQYFNVVAEKTNGSLINIGEYSYSPEYKKRDINFITIPLAFRDGTPVSVLIFDKETKKTLKKLKFKYSSSDNNQLRIDVRKYKKKGTMLLGVEVTDLKKNQSRSYQFQLF